MSKFIDRLLDPDSRREEGQPQVNLRRLPSAIGWIAIILVIVADFLYFFLIVSNWPIHIIKFFIDIDCMQLSTFPKSLGQANSRIARIGSNF